MPPKPFRERAAGTVQVEPDGAAQVSRRSLAEAKALFRLGTPMAATQFFIMAMGFLDTAMAGHYDSTHLAGVALGSNVLWPVFMLLTGCTMSVTPIVAQLVGGGRDTTRGAGAAPRPVGGPGGERARHPDRGQRRTGIHPVQRRRRRGRHRHALSQCGRVRDAGRDVLHRAALRLRGAWAHCRTDGDRRDRAGPQRDPQLRLHLRTARRTGTRRRRVRLGPRPSSCGSSCSP